MSELLAITDYDSPEFVDRLRGLFDHCRHLSQRADELGTQTTKRIEGMRRHAFDKLSEIGEAFLRLHEHRPGEFETWFAIHEPRLGFSIRHAYKCTAAAKLVREHGPDGAFAISLEKLSERPKALLASTLRLTKPVDQMSPDERHALLERLEPWVGIYRQLEAA